MEILILCGIYLVELACYQLGIRILFEVRQKTWIWMVVGILFPVVIGVLPVDVSGKNVMVTASVMVVMFISIEGAVTEKVIGLILTFLLLECVDGIFAYPCERTLAFIDSNHINNHIRNLSYFAFKCFTGVSIFLLNVIKEKINHRKTHINSVIYFVVGLIVASMLFCLAFLNQVIIYLYDSRVIVFCHILNFAILISIFLLLVFVIYIKNTHERMEQLLKTERLLKESQVNYYKQILMKEADTRKYRHDMMGHLVYIQNLLYKNRIDNAQEYLSSILGGFERIQNSYYIIGNDMVDTIMNYFFGTLPKNVEIDIRGRCPVKFNMEDTDVCTIFSNLFQNTVEEIIENSLNDARIIVEIQKGKQYVEYGIRNSMVSEIDASGIDKNGLPKTHKLDKRNHGIGLMNVRKAVERNNGKFEWYQKDGYFCVSIILPIK